MMHLIGVNKYGKADMRPIFFILALSTVVFTQSPSAQATCIFFDGFVDNNNGTVTDPRNGLIWKRCAEGSNWDGTTCSVEAKKMNWFSAMDYAKAHRFLNVKGWRLPSSEEFIAVIGTEQDCKSSHYRNGKFNFAASNMIAHSIDRNDGFPGIFFSTTPKEGDDKVVWLANFSLGMTTYSGFREDENNVRLVLDSNKLKSKRASEFSEESAKLNQYKNSISKYREEKAKASARSDAEHVTRSSLQQLSGGSGVLEISRLVTGGFSATCKDGSHQVIYEDKLSSGEMRYSNRRSGFANSNLSLVALDACK